MKKGFTLAEVMIVLVVIGVITGILLPTAIQSTPDENVMKFKKGYNILGQVIRELVTSGEYYTPGDLSKKNDGTDVDAKYLCETIGDLLNVKKLNCLDINIGHQSSHINISERYTSPEESRQKPDNACNRASSYDEIVGEIITPDEITFFNANPAWHFAARWGDVNDDNQDDILNNGPLFLFYDDKKATSYTNSGMLSVYKVFCMDIDGLRKGEDPFGFGIRIDGKIFPGARATEWINKKIQKED